MINCSLNDGGWIHNGLKKLFTAAFYKKQRICYQTSFRFKSGMIAIDDGI